MISKKLLTILIIPFMLSGCTRGGEDKPDPVNPDKPFELLPQVGEVRLLFSVGEAGETKIYNYCPTVFNENNVQHVYYCTNEIEGNVTDFVGYRKGVIKDKAMSFTDNDLVVSHGDAGSWDCRHACDPSVIKGEFKFHNETYNYLMAYLGCIPSACTFNETGIAVSHSYNGPWVKCNGYKTGTTESINPIVPYSDFDCATNSWGTGQPSLMSIDKKGRVLLLTTVGCKSGSFMDVREYDFSDINNYQLIRQSKVFTDGIEGTKRVNNADYCYDAENKRFFMAKGRSPFGGDGQTPNFIADTVDVYFVDASSYDNPFDIFFDNGRTKGWERIGSITKALSGYPRNHNTGLVTDAYGHMYRTDRIGVAFTSSQYGSVAAMTYLKTYRIFITTFLLN